MITNEHGRLLTRIYRLKTIILALLSFIAGVALMLLAKSASGDPALRWLTFWPLNEIGGTLAAAGLFGIAWDFIDARDKEAREDERIRRLLRESAPDFRDAVIKGFALHPDDLKRVATPELLDDIASNALALRLGDDQFARELYTDIRDSAIRTPERWHDVKVNVRLSCIQERNTEGIPLFEALVEWEYTTTPSQPVARFACVSDRDEFHELLFDVPATWTWLMTPKPGFDASTPDSFKLLRYSVDGDDRKITRSERKTSQVYSVTICDDVIAAAKPVRIRHAFRTLVDPANHRLFLTLAQPARNTELSIDYSATTISRMSVVDFVSTAQRPYVSQLPAGTSGKELTIEVPGWVHAGTGFTFVWTLDSEEPPVRSHTRPAAASRAA